MNAESQEILKQWLLKFFSTINHAKRSKHQRTQSMKLDDSLKHDILERLKPLQPERVILFGSYAYGEPNKDSDIDLLVVTNDDFIPQNFAQNMAIRLKVAKALDDLRRQIPMDIIVHTRPMHKKFIELRSMFSREILQKGMTLYEHAGTGMVKSSER